MSNKWTPLLPAPSIRRAGEMQSVLRDRQCQVDADTPLYFMYRNLAWDDTDQAHLLAEQVRFDMTCIPPGTICGEYVKTKGHYHPKAPDGTGYPELYQVLEGEAHYLLQKEDLSDLVVVHAKAGESVFIPPGYGHVTINPGSEELVMVNLVSDAFTSRYELYEERQGAAYYESEGSVWEKNPTYGPLPELRFFRAKDLPYQTIVQGKEIYGLIRNETVMGWLNTPADSPNPFTL